MGHSGSLPPGKHPLYLSAPGVCCCAGTSREQVFRSALEGAQGGIRRVTVPENRDFLAGMVDDPAPVPGSPAEGRLYRIADAALEQIRPEVLRAVNRYGPGRIAVCVGSCDNGSEASLAAHRAFLGTGNFPPGYDLALQGAALPAEYTARRFGLSGPVLGIATACASSAGALIKAAELIRAGFCDAAIAGGADLISETVLLGFDALEAVSDCICNPFSKNRKGITLGEGAAFFLLTPDREGNIILMGTGESADATHMTAPSPDGSGAIRAMEEALADAGIAPGDVGYVNLHGTGTPLNDRMEAAAVDTVFPGTGRPPLVSSTKPVTGHTLGAAGALELALCWMVLDAAGKNRETAPLPVHRWDGEYDPDLPELRFVRPGTAVRGIRACMSNSFAFGGCNTSLIIGSAS